MVYQNVDDHCAVHLNADFPGVRGYRYVAVVGPVLVDAGLDLAYEVGDR